MAHENWLSPGEGRRLTLYLRIGLCVSWYYRPVFSSRGRQKRTCPIRQSPGVKYSALPYPGHEAAHLIVWVGRFHGCGLRREIIRTHTHPRTTGSGVNHGKIQEVEYNYWISVNSGVYKDPLTTIWFSLHWRRILIILRSCSPCRGVRYAPKPDPGSGPHGCRRIRA